MSQPGRYSPYQVFVDWEQLTFAHLHVHPRPTFQVLLEAPKMALHFPQGELLAGVCQRAQLVLTCGSRPLGEGDRLCLKASRGLLLKVAGTGDLAEECSAPTSRLCPSESTTLELSLLAQLMVPQRGPEAALPHQLTLFVRHAEDDTRDTSQVVQLHFLPPFSSSHRLHTCNQR